MRLYEIENRNRLYSFDLDCITAVILGDGSCPAKEANSVLVECGAYKHLLIFEKSKDAKITFDHINQCRQPLKR